jgi:hypothetical protein
MSPAKPPPIKKETRRHRRFAVDVEAQVTTSKGERLTARTRDLSRSGICLITYTPVDRGQVLSVELVLSFGNNAFSEPLRLEARVVWCTQIAGHYQVGAMFDALSSDQHEFLDMFLRFLDGSLAPKGGGQDEGWEEEPTPPPDIKDDPFRR